MDFGKIKPEWFALSLIILLHPYQLLINDLKGRISCCLKFAILTLFEDIKNRDSWLVINDPSLNSGDNRHYWIIIL